MEGDELKAIAGQYLKAFETYDLSILDEIIHPDYFLLTSEIAHTTKKIVEELGKGSNVIGIEGIKNRFKQFSEVWQNPILIVQDIVAENSTVLL